LPLVIREAHAERLTLRRLDAAGQLALITSRYRIGEHDAARLAHYLQAHAEGNPLFALELLRSLEEERTLQQLGGVWSYGDTTAVLIPPLLRQVIERRLGRLENETRVLLQVAAVIGQDVPIELWEQVTGASVEALAGAIEQGLATHLLHETANGIHFQHALLRESLYESVVSLRRRGWHRKTVEALAERATPVPDSIAHHFQQAGDVRAVTWLLEAARRARMRFATATALDRLKTALELDEQHDGASGLRGWLLAGIAGWGEIFAHTDERMRMLDEAMAVALRTDDDTLAVLIEWSRALIRTNFSAPAGEMLGNARDRIQGLSPGERERLFGFLYGAAGAALDPSSPEVSCLVIAFQAQSGQYREALTAVEQIRAEYPTLSAAAEHHLDNARMACAQALGRPKDSLQCYDRLLAAYPRDHVTDWAAVAAWLKLRDLVLVYWPDRLSMR
jgi:tetratricopeptide (TPR) repeat protein